MTPIELHRLAGAIATLRPDWPASSLQTFIERHFAHRAARDVAVAMAYVALDPATEKPGRVLEAGPWWQAAATSDVPTARNTCPRHPLAPMRIDPRTGHATCAGCHVDQQADDSTAAHFDRKPCPPEARAALGRPAVEEQPSEVQA